MPRAHDSTEWLSLDALAQARAERGALAAAHRGERPDPLGERAGSQRVKRCSGGEEPVEDRVRGEHRQAGCRRLVDDLVGRAGAHVVHERVVRREAAPGSRHAGPASPIVTRPSSPSSRDELARAPRGGALLLRERRAVDVELDVVAGQRHRARPRRRAPSRSSSARARAGAVPAPARGGAHGNSSRSIPCPIARTFLDGSGNERWSTLVTAVETRSAACSRSARAPVREPEDERDAQRPHERRGEHGVDRAHVRDDRAAPQARQLARERGLEARAAQRLGARARNVRTRQFVGKHARRRRRRRARRPRRRARRARGSSAPSPRAPGCRGSTCCVMKTSFVIRRSRSRRA